MQTEGATATLPLKLRPRPALPLGPYLVAGLGRAGQAAVAALLKVAGPEMVVAWDADARPSMQRVARQLRAVGVRTILAPRPDRREVKHVRCVIKSPGLDMNVSALQRAAHLGWPVIDELELGWHLTGTPLVAVTGTNGKSTVCALLHTALAREGHRVATVGNTAFGTALSMADPQAAVLVCEVSSYQLEYTTHMLPELAVFTNLTHEHLGRHGSMERYGECKRRLFIRGEAVVEQAVVDIDGPFGHRLAAELEAAGARVLRTGYHDEADVRVLAAGWDLRRSAVTLQAGSDQIQLTTRLPGAYNARNLAAAFAATRLLETDPAGLHDACGPPGRLEHVDAGQPFTVLVDFAHSPDALRQLLEGIRAAHRPRGRIILTLGSTSRGGTGTRQMGEVAARLADEVVLTTSGYAATPRIPPLRALLEGLRAQGREPVAMIIDRRRAIAHALRRAAPGDVVVLPCRGSLAVLDIDPHGTPIPFDDRQVARELLGELAAERG